MIPYLQDGVKLNRDFHLFKIFLVSPEFIYQKNIGKMWIKPEEVLLANALW